MSDSVTPWTVTHSSSLHGILQARIREWVAMPFSRGSSPSQGSHPGLSHCRQILYCLKRASHASFPKELVKEELQKSETHCLSLGCVTKDHSRTTHFPSVLEAGSGGQVWVGWFLLKPLPRLVPGRLIPPPHVVFPRSVQGTRGL